MKADDPSRCRTVSCGAGDFTVPRHIARLEGARTAGWQVRWEGTKYFHDGRYGGPEASLKAAIKHLRKIWRPVRKKTNRDPSAGIHLYRDPQRGAIYVVASHPKGGTPRRFYAGTDNTVTAARIRAAKRLAKKARSAFLAENPAPIR